jgi:hypothetical protein
VLGGRLSEWEARKANLSCENCTHVRCRGCALTLFLSDNRAIHLLDTTLLIRDVKQSLNRMRNAKERSISLPMRCHSLRPAPYWNHLLDHVIKAWRYKTYGKRPFLLQHWWRISPGIQRQNHVIKAWRYRIYDLASQFVHNILFTQPLVCNRYATFLNLDMRFWAYYTATSTNLYRQICYWRIL